MKSASILILLIFSIGLCLLAQQTPDTAQCPPTLSVLKSLIDSAKSNYALYPDKARKIMVQVELCVQTHKEQDTSLANVYHKIGVFHRDQDKKTNEALDFFDKALVIRKHILPAFHPDLASNFYLIATCKLKQGDYMAVLNNAQEAYNIYNQIQDKTKFFPLSCSLVGTASRYCGDNEKAKNYLSKAIKLCQNLKDTTSLCIAENTLGMVYIKQTKYDSAIQHLQICINLIEDLVKKTPTNTQNYDKLGDYHTNQSVAYRLSKNNDRGLTSALTALKMYNQSSDQDAKRIANAHIEIGNCYAQKRAWATAAKEYSMALTIFERANLRTTPYYAEAFMSMGKMAAGQNDHKAALAYYQKALKVLSPDFNDTDFLQNPRTDKLAFAPMELIDVLSAKATSLYKLSQQKAEKRTPQYIEATDSTLRAIDQLVGYLRLSFAGDEAKFDLVDKIRPIYNIGMCLAKSSNNKADFLMWMEKNKALSMQENFKRQQAKEYAGLPTKVLKEEQQLKADLTRWAKAAKEDTTSAIKDNYFKAQEAIVQFENKLEKEYTQYYNLKYAPSKKLDIATIQAQLPDTMAFVEYALGDDSLFTFVASRTNAQMFSKPLPKGFTDSLNAFMAIQNNDAGNHTERMRRFTPQSAYYYAFLLKEPLAALQTGKPIKRLKIVPDGLLYYLPFDYLLEKEVGEKEKLPMSQLPYLMQHYALSYDYSAALSFELYQKTRTDAPFDFGAFGLKYDRVKDHLNVKGKTIEVLQRSYQEVAKAQKRFPSNKIWTDSLRDVSATQFLKETDKFKVSHFSGHGDFNDEECSLIFSDTSDFILRGSDIYAHDFKHTDLMVLSACNTGKGRLHRGEGVMSFGRALKYAGIPATIQTFWSVSESPTSDIIDGFYAHLVTGDTKDIALQKAKIAYLRKGGEPMPYYWSGIALMGNTDAVSFKKPTLYMIWLLACGALVGLLFVAFKRKTARLAS